MEISNAKKLSTYNADQLLKASSSSKVLTKAANLDLLKTINSASQEMDALGDIGLTVKFDEIKTYKTHEGRIPELFGAKGEFYTVATVLDGSGRHVEHKSKYFQSIKRGERLPLGSGGLLAAYIKNPTWFIDVHMLVMESDSDYRLLGENIEKARKESGLNDAMDFIGKLSAADPTSISRVIQAVNIFSDILTYLLKNNGDDHVATIHEFFLRDQAFGAGRHPEEGLRKFNFVDTAYTIELTQL